MQSANEKSHEGNYLKDSWGEVLKCISELERLQLLASGAQSDADVFLQRSSVSDKNDSDLKNSFHLLRQIEPSLVDRIFTRSATLNSEAIVDFVDHICAVSRSELENAESPRVFCLQKIVEITYYNMGRIRFVWSRIWSILAAHFEQAGVHPNINISMYAIDSLRQLATKFLEKDELSNYEFQKQFLRPFERIIENDSPDIQEFVVQCLSRVVLGSIKNVKSGWRSVFSVRHLNSFLSG